MSDISGSNSELLSILTTPPPQSIGDVLRILREIDSILPDSDGLKWFNWLYLRVTAEVDRVLSSGFCKDPKFLDLLDARFANLFLSALRNWLSTGETPRCWSVLFEKRMDARLARIQFALSGINAHIDNDLAQALVITCAELGLVPAHGTPQYHDYTRLNAVIESQIDGAKSELMVRLLGRVLPAANHLEDLKAAWGVSSARELAWLNAETLWHLRSWPELYNAQLFVLDGLAEKASRILLVPVP